MQNLNENILQNLQNILHEFNLYIQSFCQVRDFIQTNVSTEISMIIYNDRIQDSHHYNASTAFDIATIMISIGYDMDLFNQDILLRLHDGSLQRISKLYPSYDSL